MHAESERALRNSGLEYAILRPDYFMQKPVVVRPVHPGARRRSPRRAMLVNRMTSPAHRRFPSSGRRRGWRQDWANR
jgi:hypothetical protein